MAKTLSPRSREVVRPTTHRYVGRFSSVKTGRMIHWESKLERDQIMLFEMDPDVIEFHEQPFSIFYEEDGKRLRYTPDFRVVTRGGEYVIEVKPAKFACQDVWQNKLSKVSEIVASEGYGFLVLTDNEIRREPRLSNAKTLLRYRGQIMKDEDRIRILGEFNCLNPRSISEIEADTNQKGIFVQVCSLILSGALRIDFEKKFNRDAPILLATPVAPNR